MKTVHVSCLLTGKEFNPVNLKLNSNIDLLYVQERGSIGETGRYKGQPVPMASATIEDVDLDNILANLLAYYSSIKEAGVEDIWLTVTLFYTDQCNWEFTREQMKLMVEMNISLSISCQVVE